MNSWNKCDETTLTNLKCFYRNLNLRKYFWFDYKHGNKVSNSFEIKNRILKGY